MMGSMMQDLAFAIPGVDEAMSFAEIMKYVRNGYLLKCISTARTLGMSSRWNTPLLCSTRPRQDTPSDSSRSPPSWRRH